MTADIEAVIGAAGGAARRPSQATKGGATTASPDLDRPSIASEGPGECHSCLLLYRSEHHARV